jgi:hypothetical protein
MFVDDMAPTFVLVCNNQYWRSVHDTSVYGGSDV